ncbi:MAG: IS200/IS605 family element transposase accessory protein TnpB, partial [Gammaproteobacteria bacterium]|nr:IS200/IS605 family element transposase accessory protein TnpB [Gammaproteobacteria bacterium]
MSYNGVHRVLTHLPTNGNVMPTAASNPTTFRAVTFRLYPRTAAKHNRLMRVTGACIYVWNRFLAKNRREYDLHRQYPNSRRKPSVSFFSLCKQFTELRRETDWLQELPCAAVRYTLKHQADAWQRAFRHGGFPKFKSKHVTRSVTFPDPSHFKLRGDSLYLQKLGWFGVSRAGGNPHAPGEPKRCAVRQVCGKWYAVILYEVPDTRIDNEQAIGVDMNCGQVADSTGRFFHMPDTSRLEARKRRHQRTAQRRRRGSKHRLVAKRRVAKTARRIAQVRHNFAHCVSRELADMAGTVVIEDLKVGAMTRSAKGTADDPGSNVRQKASLNRSILNTGWRRLRRMLEYKAANVIALNPAFTSQTCRSCAAVYALNRET